MSSKGNTPKIIYPFGPKISGSNEFLLEWDITDQRAPVQDPGELYERYLRPEIQDELDNEKLDDFDDDISQYDYDDISELGADIAMMNLPEYAEVAKRLAKRSKARS
ncbi:hypothetical protein [Chicken microvirus mg7_25]|nr:hypothetical protein [Chicken microvirus mg7_25]